MDLDESRFENRDKRPPTMIILDLNFILHLYIMINQEIIQRNFKLITSIKDT